MVCRLTSLLPRLRRYRRCDVAFHILHPFHASFLHPIAECLSGSWVSTADADLIKGLRPRILVLADHHYEMFSWVHDKRTLVYQVPHGLLSKNTIYEQWHSQADYICLPSEAFREEFTKRNTFPRREFLVTGWPLLDELFQWRACSRSRYDGRRTILYAPTYNPELNSVAGIGEDLLDVVRAVDRDARLVIKPHPVIAEKFPGWMATWEDWCRKDEEVMLVRNTQVNIVPYLIAADVLVSDVSSVALCFLALDRPVILWRNSEPIPEGWYYDKSGVEWHWVEFAERVASKREFEAALQRAISNPEERSPIRSHYCDLIFGPYQDGHAADRIAGHIMRVLNQGC